MGPVHVRIRHDNNGVVTQLVRIELFPTNAAPQCRNQGAHFRRREHLVKARFFHVQDLTLQRQDGLGFTIAALFCATTGRVTLHNVKFGEGGVFLLAVRQFSGQAGNVQGAFSAGHVPRFPGGFTGPCSLDHLVNDQLGFVRLLLQVLCKALVQLLLDRGFHLGRHQLVLCLGGELRIRNLDADDGGQAFTGIVA